MSDLEEAASLAHIPVPPTSRVRDLVQRAGLLTMARNLRGLARRDVKSWVAAGCPAPAPNIVKMAVVRANLGKHKAAVFVETGTYLGSMVGHIAATGVPCYTIEIVPAIYERAKRILSRYRNVTLILGDSAVEISKILAGLSEPAAFWLDGHYSGEATGKGALDTPISAELEQILAHPIKRHVIMIDDARDFLGKDGYPYLSQLLATFDDHPDYRASVTSDIIVIEPRH